MAGEGIVKYGEVYRDSRDGEKVMFVAKRNDVSAFPEGHHVIRLSWLPDGAEVPYEDTMLTNRDWGQNWERVDE